MDGQQIWTDLNSGKKQLIKIESGESIGCDMFGDPPRAYNA